MREQIEAYLSQRQAEGLSETTIDLHRYHLEMAARFLRRQGCGSVTEVTPMLLDEYLRSMLEAGYRKSTLVNAHASLRGFFRVLAEAGKILSNPARALAVPAGAVCGLPSPPLEEAEVAAILDDLPRESVTDLRNRLHLELLYGCALRISESVSLDVSDCDLAAGTVLVREAKGNRERLLPMPGGVRGALLDYLALRRELLRGPDHGALLLTKSGMRIDRTTLNRCLKRINDSRGPKKTKVFPHLLRHSLAVHWLRNGADIRFIQEYLGHSDPETTKTYLRLVPERLREDYDAAMPEISVTA